MKARIKEVFYAGEYTEMPLSDFIEQFPEFVPMFSRMLDVEELVRHDDNYIIRFNEYGVEFGYYSDSWQMFK